MDNNEIKLHAVTVLLLVNGKLETLNHTEVFHLDRYREIVRMAAKDGAEKDPDITKKWKPGRHGKPVEVLEVDEAVLIRNKDLGAPHPDAFLSRRVFDNAVALSNFLGTFKTACSTALYLARGRGKKQATVRGVTFCLAEDAPE